MALNDFRERAGTYLKTPPPTGNLQQIAATQQSQAPVAQAPTPTPASGGSLPGIIPAPGANGEVGFWDSVFMNRAEREFHESRGEIKDSIGEAIVRDFVQPVANLGQDIADKMQGGMRADSLARAEALATPRLSPEEADLKRQQVTELLAAGKITQEQADKFNEDITGLATPAIGAEEADYYRRILGYSPTGKQILGDIAGTAISALSFFPALSAVKAVRAAKAAKTAVVAGEAVSVTSKLGKLSPFLRTALEGGGFVAAFNASAAAQDDETIAEIAKEAGLGFLTGAALMGGGTLAARGFTRLASVGGRVTKSATTAISESETLKYLTQYIRPVSSVIERDFGEAGAAIMKRLKNADTNIQASLGRVMRIMEDVGGRFSSKLEGREMSYQLGRILRGRTASTESSALRAGRITGRVGDEAEAIMGAQLPDDLASASPEQFYKALFGDIAAEAESRGIQIRIPAAGGAPARWQKFEALQNYFPQQVPDIRELKPGSRLREWVLRRAVDDGDFRSMDEAVQVLDGYVQFVKREGKGVGKENGWIQYLIKSGQAENEEAARSLMEEVFRRQSSIKLGSSLEHARLVNNPFYNPFPDEVAPMYAADALTRLENVAQLGVKYTKGGSVQAPEVTKAFEAVRRNMGRNSKEHFRTFLDVAMNNINNATPGNKIAHFLTSLQIPKLAFAQIVNVGQAFLNPLLATDMRATATGLMKAFSQKGTKRALESGATLQSIFNEMVHSVAGGGNVGDRFLKSTGFVWTEKFNRTVAANVGIEWASRNFERLLKNPSKKFFAQRLTELGIDVEKALARGKLTDNELLRAGQLLAEKTQFRSRPMDLPMFATNPAGKVFWQFKNFAYNQLNFVVKESLVKEVRAGNYGRAARNLLVLGTVFPMTGEVLQDIRSLVTQSKRPTKFLDRYLSDIAGAGAMGLVSDFVDSVRFDRTNDLIIGPTGGTVSDIIDNLDDPDKLLDVFLRQTGFGSPIVNAKSKPRKGYESTLESLQRLLGE